MKQKSKAATSKDVAQLANTSQPTVSRAFNNPASVNPETLERIRKAAIELDYHPNTNARILASDNSNLIGVIVKDAENPFYAAFVNRISSELSKVGKQILLFNGTDDRKILDVLSDARSYHVAGLIIASSSLSQQLAENDIPTKIPVVMINRQETSKYYCSVSPDNTESSRMVADFFVHRNIHSFAFISGPVDMPSSYQREDGFCNRVKEWGFNHSLIIERGSYTYESGYEAMLRILEHKQPGQVGLFVANDLMALGAIDAIHFHSNYRIPDDFSIIGFDDITENTWRSYNLSSVHIPMSQMIQTAFDYLSTYPEDPVLYSGRHLFPCPLIERGTT